MELNHPIETSESFGRAELVSDFQTRNKDSPWQKESGILTDQPRSLEKVPLSQNSKSGLESYVTNLKNNSVIINQLIGLQSLLSICE